MKKSFRAKMGAELVHAGSAAEGFFIEIPFDAKEVFGRARPPVIVTLNGFAFPTTLSVYGGRYYIGVRKERRDEAGVKKGDMVRVTIEPDTTPRKIQPPRELAAALRKSKAARKAWDALAFTHQREHAEAIESAKRPETRARRVAAALKMLGL